MNTGQLEKTVYRIKPEIVILDSSDRPTILGRLSRIENKIDRLLQREGGSDDQHN